MHLLYGESTVCISKTKGSNQSQSSKRYFPFLLDYQYLKKTILSFVVSFAQSMSIRGLSACFPDTVLIAFATEPS